MPPYTSTSIWPQPSGVVDCTDGFTENAGESVCAPTMRKPASSATVSGTNHAATAPPRTITWPPGDASHAPFSSTRVNPASTRR